MNDHGPYRGNSQAIRAHLDISQSVIQRMASNSAACKAWCITLVSAILVLVADRGEPRYAFIALIPAVLFLILDAYYLALEKRFRESYNGFIRKLHQESVQAEDLFAVVPYGNLWEFFFVALRSFSVWPLYLTIGCVIALVNVLLFAKS